MTLRVVVSTMFFPVSMGKYIAAAFERREDVELVTVGPYTGSRIPWGGGIDMPPKYSKAPTIPMPSGMCGQTNISPKIIEKQLPWKPDLWVQVDAGFWFTKPDAGIVAHVASDPHVLNYDRQRKECDVFFNMQTPYMQNGDKYLPFAFDPTVHYPVETEKKYDGCLIGLHYENRDSLVQALRNKGREIYYGLGDAYDEYRYRYNQSKVALSWSSLQDTPTRVFEAMGMGIPLVCNRTPDLCHFFLEGEHYFGFDNLQEAVEKFEYVMDNPAMGQYVASNAYRKVIAGHTWDMRVEQILDTCKLI